MPRFALPVSLSRLMAGVVFATLIGIAVAWLPLAAQQSSGSRDVVATPVQFAACLGSGAAETARNRATGAMRFVGTGGRGALSHPLRHDARTPMETAARGYLDVCGSLFGLSGDPAELELTRATTRNGRSVIRFQQNYRGIPVLGGELVVHLDRDRNIVATSGHILPHTRVVTAPSVTAAQAMRTAIDEIARGHDVPSQDLAASAPRLWIYSETLLGPGQGPAQLVWRIDVVARGLQPIRELVLIDAVRGNVALHFNQVETALQRQTFSATNAFSLPGALVCDEANPACAGGDAHAEAAHTFAGDTYSFFADRFGRDGITGTGSTIRSTVHYGSDYANAFWNGSQVVFGDAFGFPLADDVVGHELAHGITQNTVSLFNLHQSGAIAESLSDLWGELIDQTNARGNDGPDVRWLIGEDIAGLGAVRDMSDPTAFGHPDRMTSPLYQIGDDDNGGIHANSGVSNKAASLMVDGGTFNGQTVAPLGIDKTARIYYEAQNNLLTSSADYEDLFHALFQACSNLVGTSGIVSADCAEVRNATLAVEMDRQPMPNVTLDARLCTAGEPLRILFDDFENGAAGFSTMSGAGANRWSYDSPYGEFARSGQHMLYADDSPAGVGDSSIAMTASVTVPANAFLHFAHAYGFDQPNYDGGVVEYSVDEGASWVDAGSLFDHGGYSGAIVGGGANPLAGRSAFVGSSHGYVTSRLDLSSLAGQRVRFRWRLGLDSIGFGSGWWIDDVEIFTCPEAATAGAPVSPSPADGATGVPTDAVLAWSATGPVQSYDVAFGTVNPPPQVVTGQQSVSYQPVLATNTTYYWRITVHEIGGAVDVGPVWSFTTAGVAASNMLVSDTFTGTDALTSHTPDVNVAGTPWVVTGGPATPTLSGGVVGLTSGAGHVQASLQVGASDIRMAADYRVGANPQRLAGLAFRLTDVNNHLVLLFYNNALHFFRKQSGAYTLLASSAPFSPPAGGSTQRIEVRTTGALLTGFWNGVQVVQASDAFQQTATRHGLDWTPSYDPAAAFDNFEIRSAATIPPSPPPGVPASPNPSNGAGAVSIGAPLTWVATAATSYDVAFGTVNPPPPAVTDLTTASFGAALAGATTYYWQVTARNSSGTTTGPVWSFTTGAAPADLLVVDSFTGTGALTTHTPDFNASSAPWTITGAPPAPSLADGVVGITSGSGHVQATLQTAASDIRMRVDYRVGGNPNRLAALAFRLTDVNNHLLLLYNANALHFYRRQAGAYTLLASSATLPSVAAGSIQRMEVRAVGATLSGWWNGVQVVQTVDGFQQTATRHGLDWNAGYDPAAAFDNLEIRNAGTPVGPPPAPASPSPADEAIDVATNATLSWSSTGATTYDVALGTANPPPVVATGLTGTSYVPGLLGSTTYFWQVIARNASGSTAGPVWSFTTASIPTDVLVMDSFTGGGALSAHTPDVGGGGLPWMVTGGSGIPTLAGGTVGITPGAGHVQGTLNSSVADIRIGVDYRAGTGSQRLAGLVFRFRDANNHLLLLFYENALHFYRRENGAYALLRSASVGPVLSGSTHRLEVSTSGSTLTMHWDGTVQTAITESFLQTETRHGLDWNAGFDTEATFDNFEIRNNGTPLVPPSEATNPSPADGAMSVVTTPVLTWTASGSTSDDVSFGTANPPPLAASDVTSASYTPSPLGSNTTYFWQVVTKNAAGSTAGPVWSFTTGSPDADVLVSDTFTGSGLLTSHNPDVNVPGAPWVVTGGSAMPSLIGGVVGITPGSSHVQATLNIGIPDFRMSVDYTVGASAQRLAGLVFRFADVNNHLLLLYYDSGLHFYRRQGGNYVLLASSGTLAPIGGGTTQRIEVRAAGDSLSGLWNGVQVVRVTETFLMSATRHGLDWNPGFDAAAAFDNFEIHSGGTSIAPPDEPATPFPADGATAIPTSAMLVWSPSAATSYDVAFGTANPPPPFVSGLPTPTAAPTLDPGTTYFWQVTAHNAGGFTTGPVWTFTTAVATPPPSSLLVVSPSNGATGVPTTSTLQWTAIDAASYDVAFGTANPPASVATGLTSPTYTPTLAAGTTYYWQITARNAGGSITGSVWSFTTAAPAPPSIPSLPVPANGAMEVPPSTALQWSSAGATSYDVAFSTNSNSLTPTFTGLTSPIATPLLGPNLRYFWRVTARNANGTTLGPIWSFITSGPNQLIVSDTFSGPDATLLTSHAPDLNIAGSSWSITGSPPFPMLNSGSVGVTTGSQHTQATLLVGTSNLRMAVDYRAGSSSLQLAALAFRFTDQNNHVLLLFNAGALHFYRRVAGNYALMASSAPLPPVTPGSTHRLEVRASGQQLTGLWDGVPVVMTFDPSSGPRAGLDWNPGYDPSATFDNLEIYNLGDPPAPPAAPANPSPANNASNVSPTAALQWTAPAGALVYDVAFGTSLPLPLVITGYVPAGSPSVNVPMSTDATYLWQVIARNAGGATAGPVWTFSTASAACVDADADRLCDSFETGTGIYVSPTNTGTSPLLADTDGDGLRDGDEVLGTTGGLNLPALGSNPNKKNILLEYDWVDDNEDPTQCAVHSHRPTVAALNRLAAAFAASPVSNPDGTTGITLIQDYGQGGAFTGGNVVAHSGIISGSLSGDFYAIKSANFAPNRNGYFHYVAMAHWYTSNLGSSGVAEIAGDDLIVSLGCFGSTENVANTVMHELGHNLGLQHGGNQSCNWKPNYNSVMNYRFQFPGVDLSCNAQGSFGEANTLDYSRGTRIPLDELNLNENAGVCGGTPIDWNFNGLLESSVSYDLNRSSSFPTASTAVDNAGCSATLSTLTDHNDWATITFFGITDSDGASLVRPTVDCNNPLMPRVVPEEWRRP